MKIEFIKGDLIELTKEGKFDAVAHGCNCFHTMGSGIAPKLNDLTDGRLLKEDKKTPYGDINKMGSLSYILYPIADKRIEFFNLYTQYTYGKNHPEQVLVHWDSVAESIQMMFDFTVGTKIGIPYIGCGLAGGRRDQFLDVLEEIERGPDWDVELTVVELG